MVFFNDSFERTTLDDTKSSRGIVQDQQPSNMAEVYPKTRVWTAGANGMELLTSGAAGVSAKSGRYFVELDSTANSSMSTKVNLVNGQNYKLRFSYRSRTQTTYQQQCTTVLIFFTSCKTVPVTSVVPGGGLSASISGAGFSTGNFMVGDTANWSDANFSFTYMGQTGETALTFSAAGSSDSIGTFVDEIYLETDIPGDLGKPAALKGILPPHVPGLLSNDSSRSDIITPVVVNKQAAITLGKALFWEQGIGSDGMACASCHFHAGADNRVKNQVSPGLNHNAPSGITFENTRSGAKSGPNYTLTKADFPFNPSSDDTVTSAGTFSGDFVAYDDGADDDACDRGVGMLFHVNGVGTRNVEPRNTPTVVNAAYNYRNFWDGRANNEFNGISPLGRRDGAAGVYINKLGALGKKPLRLRNSSLASQAVGPVGSDFEMACRARQFADVGRKILYRLPLRSQSVAIDDSVLSALSGIVGPTGTYASLIEKAFAPEYWNGNCGTSCGAPIKGGTPYTQMEVNFSLFFGLAVQLYEETLVSEDTRFDRWKRGQISATASEQNGESIFNGKGKCSSCHKGPTISNAAIFQTDENVIEGMLMRDNRYAIYDRGFYNLGVVPTDYDNGGGASDPFGNPLSFSKQYVTDKFVDHFGVEPCKFEVDNGLCSDNSAFQRSLRSVAVTGTFKVPTLRNVELTGPYMHNGAMATLEQVVEFYNRGGNFNNADKAPDITPLGLSAQEQADLVAFLKMFTDDRVKYERAPFDHPSLQVPHGHLGNQNAVTGGNTLYAGFGKDEYQSLPVVGRNGRSDALPTFDSILPVGNATSGAGLWNKCAVQGGVCFVPGGAAAAIRYTNQPLGQSVTQTVVGLIFCLPMNFGLPFDTTGSGVCEYQLK